MWADHHVLKVRALLLAMPGVAGCDCQLRVPHGRVSYDPAVTGPGAIMGTLDDAGYAVATDGTGVIAESVPVAAASAIRVVPPGHAAAERPMSEI